MRESLATVGIWTHALGGGHRRDVEDAGVDREWRPHVTSGRRRLQTTGKRSDRPERLMHGTLRTHKIIFADAPTTPASSHSYLSSCTSLLHPPTTTYSFFTNGK